MNNSISIKSIGRNPVSIKWDSDKWQYVVNGLNSTDTETLNDLLSVAESDDAAIIKANNYVQGIRNRALCNPSLSAFVESL